MSSSARIDSAEGRIDSAEGDISTMSTSITSLEDKVPFGFGIDDSTGDYGYLKVGEQSVNPFGGNEFTLKYELTGKLAEKQELSIIPNASTFIQTYVARASIDPCNINNLYLLRRIGSTNATTQFVVVDVGELTIIASGSTVKETSWINESMYPFTAYDNALYHLKPYATSSSNAYQILTYHDYSASGSTSEVYISENTVGTACCIAIQQAEPYNRIYIAGLSKSNYPYYLDLNFALLEEGRIPWSVLPSPPYRIINAPTHMDAMTTFQNVIHMLGSVSSFKYVYRLNLDNTYSQLPLVPVSDSSARNNVGILGDENYLYWIDANNGYEGSIYRYDNETWTKIATVPTSISGALANGVNYICLAGYEGSATSPKKGGLQIHKYADTTNSWLDTFSGLPFTSISLSGS